MSTATMQTKMKTTSGTRRTKSTWLRRLHLLFSRWKSRSKRWSRSSAKIRYYQPASTLTLANAYEVCAADFVTWSGRPTSGDKRTSGSTIECGSAITCENATYRTSSRCISLLRGAIRLELEDLCWTIGCFFRYIRKCSKSNSKTASRPSATPSTDAALRTSMSSSRTKRSGHSSVPAAHKCM
jgi:hypothetical protein